MRKPQVIPEILSRQELKRIFMALDKPRTLIATALGYFAGLRISEVCKLRKCDFELDKERPYIKVIESKFGESRNVPIIVRQLVPIFKKYFELIPSHYVMYSKRVNGPIDKSTFSEEFNKSLHRAGLLIPNVKDKIGRVRYKYHFHTLRHTIATHMIEKGFSESYVQKFLGHKDIETVQIYTHISNPELYDKLSTMFDAKDHIRQKKQLFGNENTIEIEKLKLEVEKLRLENEKMRLFSNTSLT